MQSLVKPVNTTVRIMSVLLIKCNTCWTRTRVDRKDRALGFVLHDSVPEMCSCSGTSFWVYLHQTLLHIQITYGFVSMSWTMFLAYCWWSPLSAAQRHRKSNHGSWLFSLNTINRSTTKNHFLQLSESRHPLHIYHQTMWTACHLHTRIKGARDRTTGSSYHHSIPEIESY